MTQGFLTIEHLLEYCEEWMEDRLSFNRLKRKEYAAALLGVMPVSYTHLDVYKRQVKKYGAIVGSGGLVVMD